MVNKTSAVILAAGDSGRMGSPKLSLTFSKGVSFMEQNVSQFLLFGCSKVVVVVNHAGMRWIEKQRPRFSGQVVLTSGHVTQETEPAQLPPDGRIVIVVNTQPVCGRFYSLQQGLRYTGTRQAVFVQNVDNPFVRADTLLAMHEVSQRHEGFAWISPRYKGRGGHPILLSARLAQSIRHEMREGLNLKEYLSHEKRTDTGLNDPSILVNINTIEDYMEAGLPML